jgi:two-component system, OmpR family, sensor histidine kinase KdpD
MTREASGDVRPSPEALLREAERAERSRLRIFLGAAPGVGKTYAMLEAARERKRNGVDVVVGVVETHGRKETEALLESLEIIPRKRIDYRGRTMEEMDVDAILARHPEIVLVDELAHTNVPGSRHPKRYSDVEELLDAGIDVYSTVNIQHLESLNDVVAQITGVLIRETVPDVVLEGADEIKLIDLPPEDLIQRLREGKVYIPPQAERAVENYFRPGNLTALRELALRHAAERVDDQVQAYMQAHAVPGPWAVTERLMVCVGEGPHGLRLVRAARRMAGRRRAEWLAVFVETPAFLRLPDEAKETVAKALRQATQLGGEAVTIPGQDVASEIVRYAQSRNVTEIILGKPLRPRWSPLWNRSPVERVIRNAGDIDVRVVAGAVRGGIERWQRMGFRLSVGPFRGYLVAAGMVVTAGLVADALQQIAALPDPAMIFLTGVLFTAVFAGLVPSLVASISSLLVYDFFFVEPVHTFTATKPQDIAAMAAFLIVSVLTSQLTARAREQAEAARSREARTAALYAFTREIAGAVGIDDLLPIVASHTARLFAAEAVVLIPDGGRLTARACEPKSVALAEAELSAADWVWRHDEPAGKGTDTLPGVIWTFVPAATARGVVGVVGLRVPGREAPLPLDQRQLLEALAGQAAVAIERTRIDVVLEEKAKTEQVMEAIEDGLIVLDTAGIVVHVNEVACAILGVERDEVLGARFDDLAATHSHYLRLREAMRDFQAHPERERDRVELRLFLRGRDHHYLLKPTPFKTLDGSPAGLILVLQDVTYVRDQEARRENLVATLSHELGTPLTSLKMAIELLRRETASPDGKPRELVDTAHEDVLRLEEVAQRFLDLARTRAMTIAIERQQIDLAEVVARVAKLFTLQAQEKDIQIETHIVEDGSRSTAPVRPIEVGCDQTKLTWALSNLIANALRYAPRGGHVEVDVWAEPDRVRVSVADDGPGIPPEQQDRIFDRFAQSSAPGEIGGAGLGLAIVRDIMQAHGGRIFLDSAPGKGSRFTLELPRG